MSNLIPVAGLAGSVQPPPPPPPERGPSQANPEQRTVALTTIVDLQGQLSVHKDGGSIRFKSVPHVGNLSAVPQSVLNQLFSGEGACLYLPDGAILDCRIQLQCPRKYVRKGTGIKDVATHPAILDPLLTQAPQREFEASASLGPLAGTLDGLPTPTVADQLADKASCAEAMKGEHVPSPSPTKQDQYPTMRDVSRVPDDYTKSPETKSMPIITPTKKTTRNPQGG